MPENQWRPGEPVTVGAAEGDCVEMGFAIVMQKSLLFAQYAVRRQALLDNPDCGVAFSPEVREGWLTIPSVLPIRITGDSCRHFHRR